MRPCRENATTNGDAYLASPSLIWVTEGGELAMGDLPSTGGYRGRRAALQPRFALPLGAAESVLQVCMASRISFTVFEARCHIRPGMGCAQCQTVQHQHFVLSSCSASCLRVVLHVTNAAVMSSVILLHESSAVQSIDFERTCSGTIFVRTYGTSPVERKQEKSHINYNPS